MSFRIVRIVGVLRDKTVAVNVIAKWGLALSTPGISIKTILTCTVNINLGKKANVCKVEETRNKWMTQMYSFNLI
jgi:hypothetical protein